MFYKFKLKKKFNQNNVRNLIQNSRRHDGRPTAPPRKQQPAPAPAQHQHQHHH